MSRSDQKLKLILNPSITKITNLTTYIAIVARAARAATVDTWTALRFFDQVGHQTTSAFIENKHFFH